MKIPSNYKTYNLFEYSTNILQKKGYFGDKLYWLTKEGVLYRKTLHQPALVKGYKKLEIEIVIMEVVL
jgi:hypothetical protein